MKKKVKPTQKLKKLVVKTNQKVVEKKNDFVKLSKLFKKDSWGRVLNALKKVERADNKILQNNDQELKLNKKKRKRVKNNIKTKKNPKAFFSKIRRLYKRRNTNIKLLKIITGKSLFNKQLAYRHLFLPLFYKLVSWQSKMRKRVGVFIRFQQNLMRRLNGRNLAVSVGFLRKEAKIKNPQRFLFFLLLLYKKNRFKLIQNKAFSLQDYLNKSVILPLYQRRILLIKKFQKKLRKKKRFNKRSKRLYLQDDLKARKLVNQKYRKLFSSLGRVLFLSNYKIILNKTLNNLFITITDRVFGNVLEKRSGGMSTVKGSKRASFIAMEEIAQELVKTTLHHSFVKNKIDVYFNTPFIDKAMKTIIRAFSKVEIKSGQNLMKVKLRNLIMARKYCHNGMRPSKKRRV